MDFGIPAVRTDTSGVSLKLDLNLRIRRIDLKSFDVTDSGSSAET